MPNEEPEPLKPPPKSAKLNNVETNNNKVLKTWHIWGAAIAAMLFILVYVCIFTPYYYITGIKLNELWSLTNDICVSLLFFIIFDIWNRAKIEFIARVIVLIGSLFFAINGLIYSIVWILYGSNYSHYKWALFGSLGLTIIYMICYAIRNYKNRR